MDEQLRPLDSVGWIYLSRPGVAYMRREEQLPFP